MAGRLHTAHHNSHLNQHAALPPPHLWVVLAQQHQVVVHVLLADAALQGQPHVEKLLLLLGAGQAGGWAWQQGRWVGGWVWVNGKVHDTTCHACP
jgi:hypothetical protein